MTAVKMAQEITEIINRAEAAEHNERNDGSRYAAAYGYLLGGVRELARQAIAGTLPQTYEETNAAAFTSALVSAFEASLDSADMDGCELVHVLRVGPAKFEIKGDGKMTGHDWPQRVATVEAK